MDRILHFGEVPAKNASTLVTTDFSIRDLWLGERVDKGVVKEGTTTRSIPKYLIRTVILFSCIFQHFKTYVGTYLHG